MICPNCNDQELKPLNTVSGAVQRCSACGGMLVPWSLLAACSSHPEKFLDAMIEVYELRLPTGRTCPRCGKPLEQVRAPRSGAILTLCSYCKTLWTDFESLATFDQPLAAAFRAHLETPSMPPTPAAPPRLDADPLAAFVPPSGGPPASPATPIPPPEPPVPLESIIFQEPYFKPAIDETHIRQLGNELRGEWEKREKELAERTQAELLKTQEALAQAMEGRLSAAADEHSRQLSSLQTHLVALEKKRLEQESEMRALKQRLETIERQREELTQTLAQREEEIAARRAQETQKNQEALEKNLQGKLETASAEHTRHIESLQNTIAALEEKRSELESDLKSAQKPPAVPVKRQPPPVQEPAKTEPPKVQKPAPAPLPIRPPEPAPRLTPPEMIKTPAPMRPVKTAPLPSVQKPSLWKRLLTSAKERAAKTAAGHRQPTAPQAKSDASQKASLWNRLMSAAKGMDVPSSKPPITRPPAVVQPAPSATPVPPAVAQPAPSVTPVPSAVVKPAPSVTPVPPAVVKPVPSAAQVPPPVMKPAPAAAKPATPVVQPAPAAAAKAAIPEKASLWKRLLNTVKAAASPPIKPAAGRPSGASPSAGAPASPVKPVSGALPPVTITIEPPPSPPANRPAVVPPTASDRTTAKQMPPPAAKNSALDMFIGWSPRVLPFLTFLIVNAASYEGPAYAFSWAVILWCACCIVRLKWRFPTKGFAETTVAGLASLHQGTWRGVPVSLKGSLAGGTGAKELQFEDASGVIPLNQMSRLNMISLIFGLSSAGQYPPGEFALKGWLRRSKRPFVEVAEVRGEKVHRKSLAQAVRWVFVILLLIIAAAFLFSGEYGSI